MNSLWAITAEKVEAAVQKIVEVSHPQKLVIFGSFVRQTTHKHSDLDVLVIVRDDVLDNRQESIRIRRSLRGILMPIDILVISESQLRQIADVPGLIYREALRTGKVVYDAAA